MITTMHDCSILVQLKESNSTEAVRADTEGATTACVKACEHVMSAGQEGTSTHGSSVDVPVETKEYVSPEKVDADMDSVAMADVVTHTADRNVNMPREATEAPVHAVHNDSHDSSESSTSTKNQERQLWQDDLDRDIEREEGFAYVAVDIRDTKDDSSPSMQQNQLCDGGQEKLHKLVNFGDRVCRVCYSGHTADLENGPPVELGCKCKHGLAVAHQHCAEAWFKIKGNRTCEICGTIAQNVVGSGDDRFMEEWNNANARVMETRWWEHHRLFNILLAGMVLTFVLPWLFHFRSFFK